jgi:hypothetical protein
VIKLRRMECEYMVHAWEMKNACKILARKPEGKI